MSKLSLSNHPKYDDILLFFKENIDKLTYSELMMMVYINFEYKISCQETLIYHLKKHDIKSSGHKKYRVRNIKGLRKIFERDLFKIEKVKKELNE